MTRGIDRARVGGRGEVPPGFVSPTENPMLIAMALWVPRMCFDGGA